MRERAAGITVLLEVRDCSLHPQLLPQGLVHRSHSANICKLNPTPLLPSHVASAGNFAFCASLCSTVRWGQQFNPGHRWSYRPCEGPAQCLTQRGPHQQASPPLPLKPYPHTSLWDSLEPAQLIDRGALPQEWDGDRGQRRSCA